MSLTERWVWMVSSWSRHQSSSSNVSRASSWYCCSFRTSLGPGLSPPIGDLLFPRRQTDPWLLITHWNTWHKLHYIQHLSSKWWNRNKHIYVYLLHNAQDIECKYGFWECKYTAILHGSVTDCCQQLSSARCYRRLLTFKRGRINGGKLILSLIYLCNNRIINNLLHR